MNFRLLWIAVVVGVLSASVAATPAISAVHYLDSGPISNGDTVNTENPFRYKIVFSNPTDSDRTIEVWEILSTKLTLINANKPYSTVALGYYNKYVFDSITIPAHGSAQLIMDFKNNTLDPVSESSINSRFIDLGDGSVSEFELFVFNAVVPAIPEFPTPALPIAGVLGIAFILFRRGF